MTGAVLLLGFVTLQRLAELMLARRNTARLLARGAREEGAAHYPLIVGFHVIWLASLWWLGHDQAVRPLWLAAFVVLQGLRAWVLLSLGERWTTRIIVLPGEALVRRGPYRWLRHPNYVVVVGEIAVVPLALGLETYAVVFSLLNSVILWLRIGAEDRALRG